MTLSRFLPSLFGSTLLLSLFAPSILAQNPPAQLDLGSLPADMVEEVIIPVPGEVFNALTNWGEQAWGSALLKQDRLEAVNARASRNETALVLGLIVSNGFLAVQAEDKDQVKVTGEKVLLLADSLGVKQAVLPHAQAIIDAADKSEWNTVRQELDRVSLSVREALDELNDADVAKLISIGGWLGGTNSLCYLQKLNYNAESAGLLHQPDLVDTLHSQVSELKGDMVPSLKRSLEQIKPLVALKSPSKEQVEEIRTITQPIIDELMPQS